MIDERAFYHLLGCGWRPPQCISNEISAHPEAQCCMVSRVWVCSKVSIKLLISIKVF